MRKAPEDRSVPTAKLPPERLQQRADHGARIGSRNMTPLWQVPGALLPPQRRSPALARYGADRLPLDCQSQPADAARVLVYPFEHTRQALLGISRARADPRDGFKLRCANPATGMSPMPAIGSFAQYLSAGFETRLVRFADGTVHDCLEGRAEVCVIDQT
jgi:gentisate 1,2-dioxygenase